MTKQDFLMQLNDALGPMTGEERSAAIKYYSDYIDDAGEENLAATLAQLGTPAEVAATLLADANISGASAAGTAANTAPPAPHSTGNLPGWAILLLVIVLTPVWMPLLGVCFGVVCAVLGCLIALFVTTAALLFAGVACIFTGIAVMVGVPTAGMLVIGMGCAMAGIGVLLLMLCVLVCRTVIPAAVRGVNRLWRKLFRKKEERAV